MLDRRFKVVFSVYMLWHIIVPYILIAPGNPLAIKSITKPAQESNIRILWGLSTAKHPFGWA